MKQLLIAVSLIVIVITPCFAQQSNMGNMKGMDMSKPTTTTYQAVGVVKAVDSNALTATIAHSAVNELNWPPMTMKFQVKDKSLMDKLVAGNKVAFVFVHENSKYVVTAVK